MNKSTPSESNARPITLEEYLTQIAENYKPTASLLDEAVAEPLQYTDEISASTAESSDLPTEPPNNDHVKLHLRNQDPSKQVFESEKTALSHWTD